MIQERTIERIRAMIGQVEVDALVRLYVEYASRSRSGSIARAWAEYAPEIALKKFGDCREVRNLTQLASDDLTEMDRER
jgi:hypothetical protein